MQWTVPTMLVLIPCYLPSSLQAPGPHSAAGSERPGGFGSVSWAAPRTRPWHGSSRHTRDGVSPHANIDNNNGGMTVDHGSGGPHGAASAVNVGAILPVREPTSAAGGLEADDEEEDDGSSPPAGEAASALTYVEPP